MELMDEIVFGLEVMVIGFSVVMIALFLLYLVLLGFSRFSVKTDKSKPKKEHIASPPQTLLDEVGVAPVAAAVSQQAVGVAAETVAVINAAIAACLNVPPTQLGIVSVHPVHVARATSSWALMGRKTLMERRQDLATIRRERRK
jgi:sodium pump decarboxylase gamma subunit